MVSVEEYASCLSGVVRLSSTSAPPSPPSPSSLLAWDASEAEAAAAVQHALGSSASVMVQRSGDGHVSSVFTITYLSEGDLELLTLDRSSGLKRSQV